MLRFWHSLKPNQRKQKYCPFKGYRFISYKYWITVCQSFWRQKLLINGFPEFFITFHLSISPFLIAPHCFDIFSNPGHFQRPAFLFICNPIHCLCPQHPFAACMAADSHEQITCYHPSIATTSTSTSNAQWSRKNSKHNKGNEINDARISTALQSTGQNTNNVKLPHVP